MDELIKEMNSGKNKQPVRDVSSPGAKSGIIDKSVPFQKLLTKLKDLRFGIRHRMFVFGRKWACAVGRRLVPGPVGRRMVPDHPLFGRFYPQSLRSLAKPSLTQSLRGDTTKQSLLIRIFALLLIFLLSLPALLYYFKPTRTEAAWWDDSYGYRQQITFTHDTALTNASMRITVNNTNTLITAGKMQADCDDTRFTDNTGKLLLYKYISGCNTGSTDYDVVFPTVLNGNNLAWVYYGNPSAVSASSTSVPAGTSPSGSVTFATEEKGVSPALYLKFDEGTGTITKDSTSNGNNGGIRGALWKDQSSCLFENCLYYDGTDDQVIATNSAAIDFDQGLVSGSTFQAWVKVNSTGENSVGRIFDKGNATYLRATNASNGKADLEASLDLTGTDAMATVSGGLTINKWHLVTMAYTDDGDDEIYVYIDGILKATSSLGNGSPVSGDNNNLLIGGQNQKHFNGLIDEFKIYPYERTAAQIKTDLAKLPSLHGKSASIGDDKSVVNNGLIGWWKLDENVTGSNATDSAGLANSMLKNNNNTDFTSGKFGNSAWFGAGGANNYFSTGVQINGIKTVSFWASPSTSTNDYLINLVNGTADVTTDGSGNLAFNGATNAHFYVNGVPSYAVTAGVWNLITVTSDTPINATSFQIGRTNSGYFVTGKIDDVRLYNRALSPPEVLSLYDWGPGPVGWWKLDERVGTTANDASGNNNKGTLTGGPVWTVGKIGNAVNFNGTDKYIEISDSPSYHTPNDMTISFWLNLAKTASEIGNLQFIIYKNSTVYPWYGFQFYQLNTDNTLELDWNNQSELVYGTYGTTSLKKNTWYYVSYVKKGDSAKIYLNGIDDSSGSDTYQGTLLDTNSFLWIGGLIPFL